MLGRRAKALRRLPAKGSKKHVRDHPSLEEAARKADAFAPPATHPCGRPSLRQFAVLQAVGPGSIRHPSVAPAWRNSGESMHECHREFLAKENQLCRTY